jgi:hypothetical protein
VLPREVLKTKLGIFLLSWGLLLSIAAQALERDWCSRTLALHPTLKTDSPLSALELFRREIEAKNNLEIRLPHPLSFGEYQEVQEAVAQGRMVSADLLRRALMYLIALESPTSPTYRIYNEALRDYEKAFLNLHYAEDGSGPETLRVATRKFHEAQNLVDQRTAEYISLISALLKQEGVDFTVERVKQKVATEIEREISVIKIAGSTRHPLNEFANALLMGSMVGGGVGVIIDADMSIKGGRGSYNPIDKIFRMSPSILAAGAYVAHQVMVHEFIHLAIDVLALADFSESFWMITARSWTTLSTLPLPIKYYKHNQRMDEMAAFAMNAIRGLAYLILMGRASDQYSPRQALAVVKELQQVQQAGAAISARARPIAELTLKVMKEPYVWINKIQVGDRFYFDVRINDKDSGEATVKFDTFIPLTPEEAQLFNIGSNSINLSAPEASGLKARTQEQLRKLIQVGDQFSAFFRALGPVAMSLDPSRSESFSPSEMESFQRLLLMGMALPHPIDPSNFVKLP